ncbi:hypothetical protein [Actinospongicola halichondriae]|uniref:hypothetical protein n=1 Tax=Actinospongicola halichondriae TaxID=3236844 RepID=UPI003D49E9D1
MRWDRNRRRTVWIAVGVGVGLVAALALRPDATAEVAAGPDPGPRSGDTLIEVLSAGVTAPTTTTVTTTTSPTTTSTTAPPATPAPEATTPLTTPPPPPSPPSTPTTTTTTTTAPPAGPTLSAADESLIADLERHEAGERYRVLRYDAQIHPGTELLDRNGASTSYAYIGMISRPALVTFLGRPALAFHAWGQLVFVPIDDARATAEHIKLFDPEPGDHPQFGYDATAARLAEAVEIVADEASTGCVWRVRPHDGNAALCMGAEIAPN